MVDDSFLDSMQATELREMAHDIRYMMMVYQCARDEIMTKVNSLRKEFNLAHDYNPIEHISSRIKSPESLFVKMQRKGLPTTQKAIKDNIFDIAGVRLVCSFQSDIYRLREILLNQPDLKLLEERDYIANPKPNGYKSLHLIVEVPIYLSQVVERVPVEIQLRTVAQDFWASLEHKIYYKFDKEVPKHLTDALKLSSDVADSLDTSMERIHNEVRALESQDSTAPEGNDIPR